MYKSLVGILPFSANHPAANVEETLSLSKKLYPALLLNSPAL